VLKSEILKLLIDCTVQTPVSNEVSEVTIAKVIINLLLIYYNILILIIYISLLLLCMQISNILTSLAYK